MFKLEMKTDNAAFENDPSYEVAEILSRLARHLLVWGPQNEASGFLTDTNGNTVGSWKLTLED